METADNQTKQAGRARFSLIPVFAAIVVLLVCGVGYRLLTQKWLKPSLSKRVMLPIPLKTVPLKFGVWEGYERELSEAIKKIAGNDDYVYRVYIDTKTMVGVTLYVAYSGRPRHMVGHRPDVCYPSAGWTSGVKSKASITLDDGTVLPCNIQRFLKEPGAGTGKMVLNYYILNGNATRDSGSFGGLGWRLPNISGNPAYYVAQVQVSSSSESAIKRFAREVAPYIFELLPDENSIIKAENNKKAPKPPKADAEK